MARCTSLLMCILATVVAAQDGSCQTGECTTSMTADDAAEKGDQLLQMPNIRDYMPAGLVQRLSMAQSARSLAQEVNQARALEESSYRAPADGSFPGDDSGELAHGLPGASKKLPDVVPASPENEERFFHQIEQAQKDEEGKEIMVKAAKEEQEKDKEEKAKKKEMLLEDSPGFPGDDSGELHNGLPSTPQKMPDVVPASHENEEKFFHQIEQEEKDEEGKAILEKQKEKDLHIDDPNSTLLEHTFPGDDSAAPKALADHAEKLPDVVPASHENEEKFFHEIELENKEAEGKKIMQAAGHTTGDAAQAQGEEEGDHDEEGHELLEHNGEEDDHGEDANEEEDDHGEEEDDHGEENANEEEDDHGEENANEEEDDHGEENASEEEDDHGEDANEEEDDHGEENANEEEDDHHNEEEHHKKKEESLGRVSTYTKDGDEISFDIVRHRKDEEEKVA